MKASPRGTMKEDNPGLRSRTATRSTIRSGTSPGVSPSTRHIGGLRSAVGPRSSLNTPANPTVRGSNISPGGLNTTRSSRSAQSTSNPSSRSNSASRLSSTSRATPSPQTTPSPRTTGRLMRSRPSQDASIDKQKVLQSEVDEKKTPGKEKEMMPVENESFPKNISERIIVAINTVKEKELRPLRNVASPTYVPPTPDIETPPTNDVSDITDDETPPSSVLTNENAEEPLTPNVDLNPADDSQTTTLSGRSTPDLNTKEIVPSSTPKSTVTLRRRASSERSTAESHSSTQSVKSAASKEPQNATAKTSITKRKRTTSELSTAESHCSQSSNKSEASSAHENQSQNATPKSSSAITTRTRVSSDASSHGQDSAKSGQSIRTRLSTGSIQMNGTNTISAAKEKAEMDNIMKQIAKNESNPAPKSQTSSVKKRIPRPVIPIEPLGSGDGPPPKKRKIGRNDGTGEDNPNDYFCWICHKEGMLVCCELCPRVYHNKCLGLTGELPQDWVCPECEKIMRAECIDTRSRAMEMLSLEQQCQLLKYALDRMTHAGSDPFLIAVDPKLVPSYSDYIYNPMDLTTLDRKIKTKQYGCTEALLADAKWILHNCIIYNGAHHKLTTSAKMIIKICKHEMNEIELCPDCYLNSCIRQNDDWFSEPCRVPHTLVWAKLKGYPFWPSKALREVDGQVDVRFFGAHDRSWVPVSQCFLLSKNIPTSLQKQKKNAGLDGAIEELNIHIAKIRERFDGFEYAPFRTPYDKTDSYKPISQNLKTTNLKQHKPSARLQQSFFERQKSLSSKTASALKSKYSTFSTAKKLDSTPEKVKPVTDITKRPVSNIQDKSTTEHMETDDVSEIKTTEKAVKNLEKQLNSEKSDSVDEMEVDSNHVQSDTAETLIKETDKIDNESNVDHKESKSLVTSKEDTHVTTDVETKEIENKLSVKGVNDSDNVMSDETKVISKETIVERLAKKIKALQEEKTENKLEADGSEENKASNENTHSENNQGNTIHESTEVANENIKVTEAALTNTTTDVETTAAEVLKDLDEKVEKDKSRSRSLSGSSDSQLLSPTESEKKESSETYRKKLQDTILNCQAKLGLDEDSDSSSYESENDEGEFEEEEEEVTDDGESLNLELETDSQDGDVLMDDTKNAVSKDIEVIEGHDKDKLVGEGDIMHDNGVELEEKKSITSKPDNLLTRDSSTTSETSDTIKDSGKSDKQESMNIDETSRVTKSSEKSLVGKIGDNIAEKSIANDENSEMEIADTSQDNCDQEIMSEKGEIVNNSDITVANDKVAMNVDEHDLEKVEQTRGNFAQEKCKSPTFSFSTIDKTKAVTDTDTNNVYKEVTKSSINEITHESGSNRSSEDTNNSNLDNKINASVQEAPKSVKLNPATGLMMEVDEMEEESDADDTDVDKLVIDLDDDSDVNQSPKALHKSSTDLPDSLTSKSDAKDLALPTISGTNTYTNSSNLDEVIDQVAHGFDEIEEHKANEELHKEELISKPVELNFEYVKHNDQSETNGATSMVVEDDDIPTSSKIAEKFSKKLLQSIQSTFDEMMTEVSREQKSEVSVDRLHTEVEEAKWNYRTELTEIKHNFQLTMCEMKTCWESDKDKLTKALNTKHKAEIDKLLDLIKETKKKQWCAYCGKEAIFYCCWNTSYCDYPCQQDHWPKHMHNCLQTSKDGKKQPSSSKATVPSKSNPVQVTVSQTPLMSVAVAPNLGQGQTMNIGQPTSMALTPNINQQPKPATEFHGLPDTLHMAIQREEERRGELRPGVSPKYIPMSSPINVMHNNVVSMGTMYSNLAATKQMTPVPPSGVMHQVPRNMFINQQLPLQTHQNLAGARINPSLLQMPRGQGVVRQALYPVHVQPQALQAQAQHQGTILFQGQQPGMMGYHMPPQF